MPGAAVDNETSTRTRAVHQAERPDGHEAPPAQSPNSSGNETAMSAGEHRAERGEGRMKIRPMSWVTQLAVWALLLGTLISLGRFREVQRKNKGLRIYDDDYQDEPSLPLIIFGMFFAGTFLFVYGPMCLDAGTRHFVANLDQELNVQEYIQQLRASTPVIYFTASCYHYETRTRTVPDGKGGTKTESYLATVVTHSANEKYPFTQCEDATAVLSGADSVTLTKLHLSKEVGFLTDAGEQRYDVAYNLFCAANCRDVFQSYDRYLSIPGFKKRVLCVRNVDKIPIWVGSCCYGIASLLLLNVPYRMLLDWNTGIVRHTITKKIA